MTMVPVASLGEIKARLAMVFSDGTSFQNYVTRDMAVRTVFVMLYANAVEGNEQWIRPSQITDMTSDQAKKVDERSRENWVIRSFSKSKKRPPKAWYAANTRESIRDETIRRGLVIAGAVVERTDIDTTSAKPRYALQKDFANLFDEKLRGKSLERAIDEWRQRYLSKAALARITLIKTGATQQKDGVLVRLPNGEARTLAPGASSVIAKAVIEAFAPKFLKQPAVLWLSEPGAKVGVKDEKLAALLGIKIDVSKNLPDIILVDVGSEAGGEGVLLVFVEVVATDGPISTDRKAALRKIGEDAGFGEEHLAYMTAFRDRGDGAFKKLIPDLAWGTFVWFMSEPEKLVHLREHNQVVLSKLR